MLTNKQIKARLTIVIKYCKKINKLLDDGFIVFNEQGVKLNGKYRFEFHEPDFTNPNYCWGSEATLRMSENVEYGYFNIDQTVKEIKKEWGTWTAVDPKNIIKITE